MNYLKPCPKPVRKERVQKPRKVAIESNPLEEYEVMAFTDWLRAKKILFNISIAGAYLRPATFNRVKRMGYNAGYPDIEILDTTPRAPLGAFIEMKRKKGGIVSDVQKWWIEELNKRGRKSKACAGCEDAISFLESLGYNETLKA